MKVFSGVRITKRRVLDEREGYVLKFMKMKSFSEKECGNV